MFGVILEGKGKESYKPNFIMQKQYHRLEENLPSGTSFFYKTSRNIGESDLKRVRQGKDGA
jgi:hypothetical protein